MLPRLVRALVDRTRLCCMGWCVTTGLCLLRVSSIQTERQHTAKAKEQSSAPSCCNKQTLKLCQYSCPHVSPRYLACMRSSNPSHPPSPPLPPFPIFQKCMGCACRVSNELGAGNPKTARHTTNVGLFLTLTTTTCLNVPIFFFRYVTGPLLPSVVNPCLDESFGAPVHPLLLVFSWLVVHIYIYPHLHAIYVHIYIYIYPWHAQLNFFAYSWQSH